MPVSDRRRARAAQSVAADGERLPRELLSEMHILFAIYQEGSEHRHLAGAYTDWTAARDSARRQWFEDRGISTKYTDADPRYSEALQDVKPLTVEEWIQMHNEGKLNEYR